MPKLAPMTLETRICGIPCKVYVFDIGYARGSFSYNAPSDVDYYGYTEYDYEVQDRRGRKAEWLERKMDKDDESKLIAEIEEAIGEIRD